MIISPLTERSPERAPILRAAAEEIRTDIAILTNNDVKAETLPTESAKSEEKELFNVTAAYGAPADDKDKSEKLAEIKRKIADGRIRAGGDAVKELLAHGIALEKISFFLLSDIITEINAAPDAEAANARLEDTMGRLRALEGLRDETIADAASLNRPVTLNDAFVAANIPKTPSRHNPPPDMPTAEIERAFLSAGIDVTDENVEAARTLLTENAPITALAVENAAVLKKASALALTDLLDEDALSETRATAEQMILKNVDMKNAPLKELMDAPEATFSESAKKELMSEYRKAISSLAEIAIEKIDLTNAPISIAEVLQAASARVPETGAPVRTSEQTKADIYEIRAKMTLEAAARLAGKGLDILSEPLDEALSHIKNSELEFYKKRLKIAGAEPSYENAEKLAETFERMKSLNPLGADAYAKIISNDTPFTLEALSSTNASAVYDSFIAKPDPSLGDRIYETDFQNLLEKIDVTPNEKNARAARMLSQTGLDVTTYNIARIRAIDRKIEFLRDNLLPAVAARIIKDGADPLKTDIDELIVYIENFNERYGESSHDKIAAMIMTLDRDDALAPRERSRLIGIYRALDATLKNGGAAMGVLLKNDGARTLGGLLEAARYFESAKAGRFAVSAAVGEDVWADREALARFTDHAHPRALLKLIYDGESLFDEFDAAAEKLREMGYSADQTDRLTLLNEAFDASAETLYSVGQAGLPVTPSYIKAMNSLRKKSSFLSDAINEFDGEDLCDDSFDGDLEKALDTVKERANAISYYETDPKKIKSLEMIARAADIQNAFNERRDDGFIIPVKLSGGVSTLSVFVFNKPSGLNASVAAALNVEQLGTVRAFAAFEDGRADISIYAETYDALNMLERNADNLRIFMEDAGFRVVRLSFHRTEGTAPWDGEHYFRT
ncbi:MAG: flagellar hook-length control protein FliK [Clostridiales bacterium]|jgi:hypothetical protein|nr:flagellar hook-length control protein FliK [Clostridiales bacterium]